MNDFLKLYEQYDNTRQAAGSFTAAKYGFEWRHEDGLIFYPPGYLAASRSELLAQMKLAIPTLICDEEGLAKAAESLPRALLVLCGDCAWAEKTIPMLAAMAPFSLLSRAITHRQLGDFLPYGDKATRWWDVVRKSALPAAPKVRPKVAAAYDLFGDTISKTTFLAILRRYLLSSDAMIPYLEPEEQYFTPLYRHLENEVFIDCGGFTGDTLEQYLKLKNGEDFKEYILFEPDTDNFIKLQRFIETLPQKEKVAAHQLGVSSENRTLSFSGGEGSNSYIGQDGGDEISCVAMDEFLASKGPTFIKMDLQGHEAFALYGAKRIIHNLSPVLAISVYHFVQDLWELPLLMRKFNPGYRFYLRAYRPEEEYICYAVPDSRQVPNSLATGG